MYIADCEKWVWSIKHRSKINFSCGICCGNSNPLFDQEDLPLFSWILDGFTRGTSPLYFQIGHSWMTSLSQNRHFQVQYYLLILFANRIRLVSQLVKYSSSYRKIEDNRKQEVHSVSNQPCRQPRPQMKVSKKFLSITSSSLKENKTRDWIK